LPGEKGVLEQNLPLGKGGERRRERGREGKGADMTWNLKT